MLGGKYLWSKYKDSLGPLLRKRGPKNAGLSNEVYENKQVICFCSDLFEKKSI